MVLLVRLYQMLLMDLLVRWVLVDHLLRWVLVDHQQVLDYLVVLWVLEVLRQVLWVLQYLVGR